VIEFTCSKCNRLLAVQDLLGGRRVACPYCQTEMAAPLPEALPADDPPASLRQRYPRTRERLHGAVALLACAAAMGLAILLSHIPWRGRDDSLLKFLAAFCDGFISGGPFPGWELVVFIGMLASGLIFAVLALFAYLREQGINSDR
jgi:hypothetical protein